MAVKILRFKDGLDVICDCIFEKNNKLVIDNPMLFELRGTNLMLQHWLPVFVMKGESVEVGIDNILCTMDPTDDFEEYYSSAIIKLKDSERKEREVELNDEVLAAFEEKEIGKSLIH
jgi:hypothetical protein